MSILMIAITALLVLILIKPIIRFTFWAFVYAYAIPVVIYIKTKALLRNVFGVICRL